MRNQNTKNYWIRSMYRFLETMLWDGSRIKYLNYHLDRIIHSLEFDSKKDFKTAHTRFQEIQDIIHEYAFPLNDSSRVRILYDSDGFEIEVLKFAPSFPGSFKCIEIDPAFDYSFKYANRERLDHAFENRGEADEVILLKNGWVTDTSKANLAFRKNGIWYTPYFPLLAGTTWKRLIRERAILPRPIHIDQVNLFDSLRSFNALHEFQDSPIIPVSKIIV